MKKLKIVFYLISLLCLISCGENKENKMSHQGHSTPVENFSSVLPDFHYYTDGANNLQLDMDGFFHSTRIEKSLLTHEQEKHCKYYEDVTTSIKKSFQSLDATKYFDFYVDGVQVSSIIAINTYLLITLPEKSYKLEIKLKPHLRGKKGLNRYQSKRPKDCIKMPRRRRDTIAFGTPLVTYEQFAEIEKLKEIKFQIELTKSFYP